MDENKNKKNPDAPKQDPEDTDMYNDTSVSMRLSIWAYWHTFIGLGIIAIFAFYFASLVPDDGMRIYDILGKPEVSKATSKLWLNILKIRFSADTLLIPLYAIMVANASIIIYFIAKVYTTIYNINFRFLEEKKGVFNQSINQIDLFMIRDSYVDRPLIYRILGISRVVVISTDKTHPELKIVGVDKEEGDRFINFIRNNAYGNYTEYRIAEDKRRRREKGPKGGSGFVDGEDGDGE